MPLERVRIAERGGVVEEIGIAQASVTGSKKADRTFLTSFS
jgi:hypothetical protein